MKIVSCEGCELGLLHLLTGGNEFSCVLAWFGHCTITTVSPDKELPVVYFCLTLALKARENGN